MTIPGARPGSLRNRLRAALPAMALLVGGCGGGAGSPAPRNPAAPTPSVAPGRATEPATSGRATAVLPDPAATVLAAAVVVPGSAWELVGTEGLTVLTARALLAAMAPSLEAMGAQADVECGRAAFTFRLIAPASAGEAALGAFLDGVFRPRIDPTALALARRGLAAALALDGASPAWQARLAGRRALYGDRAGGDAWAAPACGVPESLERFDTAWVRAGAYRFQPGAATVAVTGAVDSARVAALLDRIVPRGPRPPLPAPPPARPGRLYVERNTVTAWLTVAWPFGAGADVEAVRLVGALLASAVGPSVDRPEVLDAGVELAHHGAGGALFVHLVVAPERAAAWADRLEAEAAALAGRGVPAGALERVGRRERGRRLLERAAPESRAGAMARALARGASPGDGWPEPVLPAAAHIRAAAGALGPPGRSVVGPRSARNAVIERWAVP